MFVGKFSQVHGFAGYAGHHDPVHRMGAPTTPLKLQALMSSGGTYLSMDPGRRRAVAAAAAAEGTGAHLGQ